MVDIITSFAMGIVRGILNSIIGGFSPEQLTYAIDTDYELWEHMTPELKNKTMELRYKWGNLFNRYYDMITTPLIIDWQQKDHPSLYTILVTHPKGQDWLDHQVTRFKTEIRGY